MSLDNTWVQWVLLGIRQFYLISSHLIGLTEFFWDLRRFIGFYWVLPDFTGFGKVL